MEKKLLLLFMERNGFYNLAVEKSCLKLFVPCSIGLPESASRKSNYSFQIGTNYDSKVDVYALGLVYLTMRFTDELLAVGFEKLKMDEDYKVRPRKYLRKFRLVHW